MSKFFVFIPELHYSKMEVEAETPEQAIELCKEGEGELLETQFERGLYDEGYVFVVENENEEEVHSE